MNTRIEEHPVLGVSEKGQKIEFTFDGRTLEGYEGEPVSAALKSNGVLVHRYTIKRDEPRGVFCAIGRCTDCIMIIDGVPNVRSCTEPLRESMVVQTQMGKGPQI